MNLLRGTDRGQAQLLPPCVEDYVGPDNPVRFLDAFVATLDLRALGFALPKENPEGRGRPAYPPADLLRSQFARPAFDFNPAERQRDAPFRWS